MAKSVGFGVVEFAGEFQRLKPDLVLLIGDRYEALAAAIAAAYMNICIVHVQGGEVCGSIDEAPATRSPSWRISIFPARGGRPNICCAWGSARHDSRHRLPVAATLPATCSGALAPEIINDRGQRRVIDRRD